MNPTDPKQPRLLGIAPSSRGFGFAVLEGKEVLVDWGVKSVKRGEKNAQSLKKVEELIAHYQPDYLVLPDTSAKGSRRAPRIRALSQRIMTLAVRRKLKVKQLNHSNVKRAFFATGEATKHELAELIAQRLPDELGFRVPPKRRAWTSEDARMDIFDAVALVLACR